jgi:hypothetical protein
MVEGSETCEKSSLSGSVLLIFPASWPSATLREEDAL